MKKPQQQQQQYFKNNKRNTQEILGKNGEFSFSALAVCQYKRLTKKYLKEKLKTIFPTH